MTRLAESTWPAVAGGEREVLVVPIGSLEQHGPHLPLDTDAFVAAAVARGVEAARPQVGLAPALPIGSSGEHAGFPGTLSIGTTALRDVVVELVRHASADWRWVLVLNGHGGNVDALEQATRICQHEHRSLAVVHLALAEMDAHAGHAETSLMLHLAPERVMLDRARPGPTTPIQTLLPRLRTEGVRAVSTTGVLGDPTRASGEEGQRLFGDLVAKAVAAVDQLTAG